MAVRVDRVVAFALDLRIPAWAEGATVGVDGITEQVSTGVFHRVEREWSGETRITLRLPMSTRIETRPRNAISIVRGPLVYGLQIGEEWKRVNEDKPHRELPHADYEVYATTLWNYALAVSEDSLAEDIRFEEREVGKKPFSSDGAPVIATVKGRGVSGWALVNGSADVTPEGPLSSDAPEETLTLIPYGCTNLRIGEFPVVG